MRFVSLITALAVCILLESGCSKGITRATTVTVFFVNGDVVSGNADGNHLQPVKPETKIQDGDTVRTSQSAAINLALVPGAFAQLAGDSEMKIEELKLVKDGNETAGGMVNRYAHVRLNRGNMSILFSQPDRSASDFVITTNQSTITPDSDCLFSVWTDGTSTRVTCGRGEVTATGSGQATIKIAAGYFHQWPTHSIESAAATGDASAQTDIRTSLQAEKELLDQAAGWQNRRVF